MDNVSIDSCQKHFVNFLTTEKRASNYTLRNYTHAINLFINWLSKSYTNDSWKNLSNVSKEDARGFLISCQKTITKRTLHGYASALRSFFSFLVAQKIISHNHFSEILLPKLEKNLPFFLTQKQINTLLNAPNLLKENNNSSEFEISRDRMILELLYASGMRVGELVKLTYGQINFTTGIIRIIGKGKKERLLPLGKIALKYLQFFKLNFATETSYSSPVIINQHGQQLSPRNIQLLLKKYLMLSGLPNNVTPHTLRHSYATHLLNNGANLRVVQELLGHEHLSTTQIYTHVNTRRLKTVHKQSHPRG